MSKSNTTENDILLMTEATDILLKKKIYKASYERKRMV